MFFNFSKVAKKISFIAFLLVCIQTSKAQCFEIESILVDACGSPEGENEMLRFKVGNSALNTSDISISWASANPWLGIIKNSETAATTLALNNTIIGCGQLIEPTAGILPAQASVLLITSTAIDVNANSFTNLNDTLYIIYQNSGNTSGHFGNYDSSPGLRTLTINFSSPVGCSDVVTYERSLLLNQNGTLGGNSSLKDGASVNFDPAGNANYYNNGCQAPIDPISITAVNNSSLTICSGDSISLSAIVQGNFESYIWLGNYGTFNNNNTNINSTYYSSINDTIPFKIYVGGITSCNDTIFDSLDVSISSPTNISIDLGNNATICPGIPLTLHTTGNANIHNWSDGSNFDSLTVTSAGEYWVMGINGSCLSDSDTINIIEETPPTVSIIGDSIICLGSSLTLEANGFGNFVWSTGDTGNSTIIDSSQQVTIISTNGCGTQAIAIKNITTEDCNINTSVIIPNVFTPNNDLNNDTFTIKGVNILSMQAKVYNRWGLLIFEWNDINTGWDGKNSSEGTYFYTVEITYINNKTEKYKGTVLLLK